VSRLVLAKAAALLSMAPWSRIGGVQGITREKA
jgi:hypothetical protein